MGWLFIALLAFVITFFFICSRKSKTTNIKFIFDLIDKTKIWNDCKTYFCLVSFGTEFYILCRHRGLKFHRCTENQRLLMTPILFN